MIAIYSWDASPWMISTKSWAANLSSEEADTLGGYIYHHLGRVPGVGDAVRAGKMVLTVEQVTGRRIRKVGARWSLPLEQKEEEDNEMLTEEQRNNLIQAAIEARQWAYAPYSNYSVGTALLDSFGEDI